MAMALARAAKRAEQGDARYGATLLAQIEAIQVDLARLQAAAEQGSDRRAAIGAIRERLRSLELTARLTGELGRHDGTPAQPVMTVEELANFVREAAAAFGWTLIEHPAIEGEAKELPANQTPPLETSP
jgi:hypothetical protein